MAEPATLPETAATDPILSNDQPDSDNSTPKPSIHSDLSSSLITPFPNMCAPPPPSVHPSFRLAVPLVPVPSFGSTPLFSPLPPYQNHGVPPPGVSAMRPVTMASASGFGSGAPPQFLMAPVHQVFTRPYAMASQPLRYPMPLPNGYPPTPQNFPQVLMPTPVHS